MAIFAGMTTSLIIGLRYARHLARKHNKPLIPVHHMEAHALTARLNNDVQYPFLCFLASGGHCLLAFVKNVNEFHLIGESTDEAPGECFDKVARALLIRNLPEYQDCNGGKAIELAAYRATDSDRFQFPLPLQQRKNCQFSFSGLKTSAFLKLAKIRATENLMPDEVIPHYEDFCAAFLKGVTKHMLHRTQRAIEFCKRSNLFDDNSPRSLVFSGGVACNDFIFKALSQMSSSFGYTCYRPIKRLCSDNGVMIAWNGVERWTDDANKYINTNLDAVWPYSKSPFEFDLVKNVEQANISCDWVKVPCMRSKTLSETL